MDNDDLPVGRVLSRREAFRLLSTAGAITWLGGSAAAGAAFGAVRLGRAAGDPLPACLVRPELMEGPYFIDARLDRSDIRAEPSTGVVREGAPLALSFQVSRVGGGGCFPLAGALVDVWQCDARGEYSAFEDRRAGFDTRGERYLRGQQVTDADGVCRFTTIYPGWYRGRAVHIHFKIRTEAATGGSYEFTSQLFFDEALTDRVHAAAPYADRGRRDTLNSGDGIFRRGGEQLTLDTRPEGSGYVATFSLGLDLSDEAVGRRDGRSR